MSPCCPNTTLQDGTLHPNPHSCSSLLCSERQSGHCMLDVQARNGGWFLAVLLSTRETFKRPGWEALGRAAGFLSRVTVPGGDLSDPGAEGLGGGPAPSLLWDLAKTLLPRCLTLLQLHPGDARLAGLLWSNWRGLPRPQRDVGGSSGSAGPPSSTSPTNSAGRTISAFLQSTASSPNLPPWPSSGPTPSCSNYLNSPLFSKTRVWAVLPGTLGWLLLPVGTSSTSSGAGPACPPFPRTPLAPLRPQHPPLTSPTVSPSCPPLASVLLPLAQLVLMETFGDPGALAGTG